jgi:hypothetical protein
MFQNIARRAVLCENLTFQFAAADGVAKLCHRSLINFLILTFMYVLTFYKCMFTYCRHNG